MKKHCIGLLAFTVTSVVALASANAADMYRAPEPVAGGYKDEPLGPSWAGFYVGANLGGAWGDTAAIDQLATNGKPFNKLGDTFKAKVDGVLGGGTIGYNWQRSNFVFGVEGDLGYLGEKGTATSSLASNTKDKSDGGLYATARARLGYAFDRTLVYGTGGYFGADLNSKVFTTSPTFLNTATAGFQSGWTAGGGVEHMFNPAWSVKVEYLYYDLGKDRVGGPIFGGTVTQFFDIANTGNIVRAGVNYHVGSVYEPLK